MSPEFQKIAYRGHFSRFPESWEELSKQWDEMVPEHKAWAQIIANNIPDPNDALKRIQGNTSSELKKRSKIIEDNKIRQAELIAFFRAPTEEIEFGEMKGLSCRREVFKKAFADRDQKVIKKVVDWTASATAAAATIVGAAFMHRSGVHIPHSIGEVVPAVKSLGVYATLAGSVGIGAKKILAEKLARFVEAAEEMGALQRLVDDPPLAKKERLATEDAAIAPEAEKNARRFNELTRKSTPADRLELIALKAEKALQGLEALNAWRNSVDKMEEMKSVTFHEAAQEQKRLIKATQAMPAWANKEFKELREVIEDKASRRGLRDMGIVAWGNWKIAQGLARKNPLYTLPNESANLFTATPYQNAARTMKDKLTINRQKNRAADQKNGEEKKASNTHVWIRPPRR